MNNKKKKKLKKTVDFLVDAGISDCKIAVVLGTGLDKIVDHITIIKRISFSDIPNFPKSTVKSHKGYFILAEIEKIRVIFLVGRVHLYEGFKFWQVTYGIRVLKSLGIEQLLISNASGSLNKEIKRGELMLVNDHINLQGGSPLAFKNSFLFGERFIDLSEPYSSELIEKAKEIALTKKIDLKEGVYVAVHGPHLETKAEYKMLKILGADAVGMSTVPEVIVAKQLNMNVLAVAVITDECQTENLQELHLNEIIEIAEKASPKLESLFTELIKWLGTKY